MLVEMSRSNVQAQLFLRVWLDIDRIQQKLQQEDRDFKARDAVLRWLKDAGFCYDSMTDTWLVAEADLGRVRPDEVAQVASVDEAELRRLSHLRGNGSAADAAPPWGHAI